MDKEIVKHELTDEKLEEVSGGRREEGKHSHIWKDTGEYNESKTRKKYRCDGCGTEIYVDIV